MSIELTTTAVESPTYHFHLAAHYQDNLRRAPVENPSPSSRRPWRVRVSGPGGRRFTTTCEQRHFIVDFTDAGPGTPELWLQDLEARLWTLIAEKTGLEFIATYRLESEVCTTSMSCFREATFPIPIVSACNPTAIIAVVVQPDDRWCRIGGDCPHHCRLEGCW